MHIKKPTFRHFQQSGTIFLVALALMVLPAGAFALDSDFTSEFPIAGCNFKSIGSNPYFPLQPGTQVYLNNDSCLAEDECEEFEEVLITVLNEKRDIMLELDGEMRLIKTRVIEEREMVDGEIEEVSRNFFAECKEGGDVYYFGEDVDIYEDGEIVSHDGAWVAGENGAMPGIIMPGGAFLVGARYYQEVAPGIALDRAEHIANGLEIEVPGGEFEHCVEVEDTNELAPDGADAKIYCPGAGLVVDEDLELVTINSGN